MKYIDRRRAQCTSEAVDFLKSELYPDNPDSCPEYLYLGITHADKERNKKIYEEDLKIFKTLFNAGNSNYKIALWNDVFYRCTDKTNFCKRDFSKEELAFVQAMVNANDNNLYEANVNNPIKTDRLILRNIVKNDFKLFAYHYKHDGDFVLFTGLSPTDKNIRQYATRRSEALFTIEDKTTGEVMGYVGLTIHNASATGLLEYYVFKEHRRQGYCREAATALISKALNKKLYKPVKTVRENIYKRRSIEVHIIRARISSINTASIKTVESCGFIHEATIHQTMYRSGLGWTDEEIYYITKENVK